MNSQAERNKTEPIRSFSEIVQYDNSKVILAIYMMHRNGLFTYEGETVEKQTDYGGGIAKSFKSSNWGEITPTKTDSLMNSSFPSSILKNLEDDRIVMFKGKRRMKQQGPLAKLFQLSPEIIFNSRPIAKIFVEDFYDIFGCEMSPSRIWWLNCNKEVLLFKINNLDLKTDIAKGPLPTELRNQFELNGISLDDKAEISNVTMIPHPNLKDKKTNVKMADIVSGEEERYSIICNNDEVKIYKIFLRLFKGDKFHKEVDVEAKPDNTVPGMITSIHKCDPVLHTILFRLIGEFKVDINEFVNWMSRFPKFDYLTILNHYLEVLSCIKHVSFESNGYIKPYSKDEVKKALLKETKRIWEDINEISDKYLRKHIKNFFLQSFCDTLSYNTEPITIEDFDELKKVINSERWIDLFNVAEKQIENKILFNSKINDIINS